MATEEEASNYKADVAGNSVRRNYDCVLVSWDLVDVVSKATSTDEFPSSPEKLVHLVFRAETERKDDFRTTSAKTITWRRPR